MLVFGMLQPGLAAGSLEHRVRDLGPGRDPGRRLARQIPEGFGRAEQGRGRSCLVKGMLEEDETAALCLCGRLFVGQVCSWSGRQFRHGKTVSCRSGNTPAFGRHAASSCVLDGSELFAGYGARVPGLVGSLSLSAFFRAAVVPPLADDVGARLENKMAASSIVAGARALPLGNRRPHVQPPYCPSWSLVGCVSRSIPS